MSHKHRGKLSTPYSLNPNTTLLYWPRSDGDSSNWPTDTTEIEDGEGNVNFHMPIPDDTAASLKWLHQIGKRVAQELGKPPGDYAFASWPEGYRFFDHHKGPKEDPRHDPYVYGSKHVKKFRSVPEFFLHAVWLMTDASMTRTNCGCKYCAGRKQTEISQETGFLAPPSARPKLVDTPRRRRAAQAQPFAVVQHTKRVLRAQHKEAAAHKAAARALDAERRANMPKIHMPGEAYRDLRAAAQPHLAPERALPRHHRLGELLWVAIATPVRSADGAAITRWPAVVKDWVTKPYRYPVPGEEPGAIVFYTVHRTHYECELLGVDSKIEAYDAAVLPYAAWGPPPALIDALKAVPVSRLLPLDASRRWAPGGPDAGDFARAAGPYCVALEAAGALAETWAPSHEWDAELEIPGGSSEWETRYQGFWWGAERIWAGDLVLLKMPRAQLHLPHLADGVEEDVGERGVFMRLNALTIRDRPDADGLIRRDVLAAGDLFEVVEAEPEPPAPATAPAEQGPAGADAAGAPQPPNTDTAVPPADTVPAITAALASADLAATPRAGTPVTAPAPGPSQPAPTPAGASAFVSKPVPDEQFPPAPREYAFRALLVPGDEAVVSLALLGGRYYPDILFHPLLKDVVEQIEYIAQHEPDGQVPREAEAVLALHGLRPGAYAALDPGRFVRGRALMISGALERAEADVGRDRELRAAAEARAEREALQVAQGAGALGALGEGLGGLFAPPGGATDGDGMDVDMDVY